MRSRHDPFRQADWRASICQALLAQCQEPSRRRDDYWTWSAWSYFLALRETNDEQQRGGVRRDAPDLAAAVDLHTDCDTFRRWELEARLLSREPVASVAGRFGLTVGAVEAYAALYFDVLDALDATDYIIMQVIGLRPTRTFTEQDADVWLKLYAYMAGPHVLDALLDYFHDPEPVPTDDTQVAADRLRRVALHTYIRAAIAARCSPFGDPRPVELLLLAEHLQKLVKYGVCLPDKRPVDLLKCAAQQDRAPAPTEPIIRQRRAG